MTDDIRPGCLQELAADISEWCASDRHEDVRQAGIVERIEKYTDALREELRKAQAYLLVFRQAHDTLLSAGLPIDASFTDNLTALIKQRDTLETELRKAREEWDVAETEARKLAAAFRLLKMVALPPYDVSGNRMWDRAVRVVEEYHRREAAGKSDASAGLNTKCPIHGNEHPAYLCPAGKSEGGRANNEHMG